MGGGLYRMVKTAAVIPSALVVEMGQGWARILPTATAACQCHFRSDEAASAADCTRCRLVRVAGRPLRRPAV